MSTARRYTVEQAIHAQYGVRLPPSPCDMVRRAFRIDQFRNGYLFKLPGAAYFGSLIDDECFVWEAGDWRPVDGEDQRKDNAAIRFEWLVWRIAQALVERGEKLSRDDLERLALAVQRLEAWL